MWSHKKAMQMNSDKARNPQEPKAARHPSPQALHILAAMMVRRVQRLQRERDDGDTPLHAQGKQTLTEVQQTAPTKPRQPVSEDQERD